MTVNLMSCGTLVVLHREDSFLLQQKETLPTAMLHQPLSASKQAILYCLPAKSLPTEERDLRKRLRDASKA